MPVSQGQHQCQRAGPERLCQLVGGLCPDDVTFCGLNRMNMRNQRVEAGSSLRGIKRGDGLSLTGIRAKPVYRFGGKRDQLSILQERCSLTNILRLSGQDAGGRVGHGW